MHILTSSYTLDPAGVPTYTVAMARALETLGHFVWVYSPHGGKLESRLTWATRELPNPWIKFDAIVAQHTPCAQVMAAQFPHVPFVYSAHGYLPEIEQPPLGIRVDRWTAINERVRDHVTSIVGPVPVDIIRDFVDTVQFRPLTPLRDHTPRVLFVSNYKRWQNWARLSKACQILGYPLTAVGAPYGRAKDMTEAMNNADLIVSWGRGILEGMACGRTVMSFDKTQGDGYLDAAGYLRSRQHQFSAGDCTGAGTVDWLVEELQKYNPTDGLINRVIIEQQHDWITGARAIERTITHAQEARHA